SGEVIGCTPTDLFHFPSAGSVTTFNALNGLRSQVINSFACVHSTLYAITEDGTYRHIVGNDGHASFEAMRNLTARYNQISPYGDGLLLARFGGVDWFDGVTVRPAYEMVANSAYVVAPARAAPRTAYVAEVGGIVRLAQREDGSFERTRF